MTANLFPLAHHIRNRSSKTFDAACAIRARCRWCLTGTPIHNRLDDYGALLSFIGVPPFTRKDLFDHWLAIPTSNNTSEGIQRLKKLVAATCLRRTKDTVKNQLRLPRRIDREETVELDGTERELYDFFKTGISRLVAGTFSEESRVSQQHQRNILPLISFLRLICDHGERLLPAPALKGWLRRGTSAFDWNIMPNRERNCALCNVHISRLQCQDDVWYESCLHVICSNCVITDNDEKFMDDGVCPICNEESATPGSEQSASTRSRDRESISTVDYRPSTKVQALLNNLQHEQYLNHANMRRAPIKRHAIIRMQQD